MASIESQKTFKLTTDLVYYIIGILSADTERWRAPKVVKMCALVSRSWREAARPHILGRVTLSSHTSFNQFNALLDSEPIVRTFVRELTLHRPNEDYTRVAATWATMAPGRLSEKLPRLHTLRLRGLLCLMVKPGREWLEGLSSFASLERLILRDCFYPLDFALLCASALPRLRTLEIEEPRKKSSCPRFDGSDCPTHNTADLLHISKLRFWDALEIQSELLARLAQFPDQHQLRSLSVEIEEKHLPSLLEAIAVVGPHLEELTLHIRFCWDLIRDGRIAAFGDQLLGLCTTLRRFTVYCSDSTCLSGAVALLERVRSPRLERVGILFQQYRSRVERGPDFEALGVALAGKNMAHVKTFKLTYDGPIMAKDLWRELETVFPRAVWAKLVLDAICGSRALPARYVQITSQKSRDVE